MSSKMLDVFVICAAEDIGPGEAKSFSLSRINETGDTRPFPIVIMRIGEASFVGYVNTCPHERVWLNIGDGNFLSEDQAFIQCGRHGAKFEIETGLCVEGPCKSKHLEPIALALIDGEVCACGIPLAEESDFPYDEELDDTMEVMIHPD